MIIKLRLISNEDEEFVMDVKIDGSSNFLTLHQFIQNELGYDPNQLASFFITDHEWNKETEITLVDMMTEGQADIIEMNKAIIDDHIASNKQRMLYMFDMFSERLFFMEVFDIERGSLEQPEITHKSGRPPKQIDMDLMNSDLGNISMEEFEIEEELDELYHYDNELDDELNISDFPDEDYR